MCNNILLHICEMKNSIDLWHAKYPRVEYHVVLVFGIYNLSKKIILHFQNNSTTDDCQSSGYR